jgi:hypothetical protein
MNSIGYLLCGHDQIEGKAKIALGQLSISIDSFASKAIRFVNDNVSDEILSYGPFCARVLLENSCAALVGRLDSFRIIYLSEFQSQPKYEHGKRAQSAFSWTGDVIPNKEPLQSSLWCADNKLQDISRALFSQHLDSIFWRPAVEKMLDFVSGLGSEPALKEILEISPDGYINETKGKSITLYSKLSKGVHWEFFTSALLFDEVTVKDAIRDTCLLVSHLGLISHFIPTAYASLEHSRAVEEYISFRNLIL